MRLPPFEHLTPTTIEEACSFLAAHETSAVALAGGTDLLVKMKHRIVVPRYVVSLKGISGLDGITDDREAGLRIGALTTIQSLKNSSVLKRRCKILAQAAAAESTVQIRNLATIGGNIANASPGGDAPLALIAAGASVVLTGVDGRRTVLVEDFFTAPGGSILEPGELLTEIRVPPLPPGSGVAFSKHSLRRTDIAIVSTAVVLTLEGDRCARVRVALGAAAPTIMRAPKAEAVLAGKSITEELAAASARQAAAECSPIDDIRGSAKYRRRSMVEVTKTAVLQALQDARTGSP